MRFAAKPLVVITLVLAAMVALSPRVRAQEVQVPFDHAGRCRTIDLRTARRIGVFADTTRGFQEARLFMLPDSSLVLERTSVRDGQLVRERSPLSADAASALRERVTLALGNAPMEPETHAEGRMPLVVGTVALGLGFYGWAVPYSFQSGNSNSNTGLYLITLSGSFFLPWFVASQSSVTYAMSNMALYGATRGIAHGALLHTAVHGNAPDDGGAHPALRWAVAGSLAEGTVGYLWARNGHMSNGTAGTIATFGDFGMLEAGCAADAAGAFGGDGDRGGSMAIVAGGVTGMLAGRMLAGTRNYTYGDASILRTTGMLGGWAGLSTASGLGTEMVASGDVAIMVGSALGLVLGDRLVADKDFASGNAVAVSMGTFAGGLLGLGVVASASGGNKDPGPNAYLMGSVLGAAGGFALTYSRYASDARRAGAERSSWNVELSPQALVAGRHTSRTSRPSATAPALVSVRYRFP